MPDIKPTTDPINKIEFGRLMQLSEDTNERLKRLEIIIVGSGTDGGVLIATNMLKSEMKAMQDATTRIKNFIYGVTASLFLSLLGIVAGMLTHKIVVTIP